MAEKLAEPQSPQRDTELQRRGEAAGGDSGLPVPLLITIALILVIATGGYFYYQRISNRQAAAPVLTAEAAAYLPNLQLNDVEMKAKESFLQQAVTSITGKITNAGPRTIRLAEINCVFRDVYGQIVLRERVAIVGRKTGPVASGQTRSFELTFDNIPASWNQAMPDLVISQIQFE